MPAASTDNFRKTANNFTTTLSSGIIGAGDTSMSLASTANLPTDTGIDLVIDRVDSNGNRTPAKREYVKGVVTGSTITNLVRGLGGSTAQAHANGAVVEAVISAQAWNDQTAAISSQHNQDGTHKSVTTDTLVASTGVTAPAITENGSTLSTMRSEALGDFVASGCVWSISSGLVGAMTAGVVYIGGKRIVVSAIASQTFVASKDTYISVDNTGTVSIANAVNNNVASPALPANNIWLGIGVSGASLTSFNLGLTNNPTAPTVNGRILIGTDSNGVSIYPASASVKSVSVSDIGASESTSSTSYADLATVGPVAVVNVGRSGAVRITWGADAYNPTAGAFNRVSFVASGANTIAAGTHLVEHKYGSDGETPLYRSRIIYGLTPGVTTFKVQYQVNTGTGTFLTRHISVEAL